MNRQDPVIGHEPTTAGVTPEEAGASPTRGSWRGVGRICLFCLVFALAATGLNATLNYGLRRVRTSGVGALNAVMTGRAQASVLVSGSSRAVAHYDPETIGRTCGKPIYNIGRNASHTDLQVAILKTYLRHHPKPELLVHNLDTHTFVTTPELYDPAQYLPFLNEPDLYAALARINPGVWKWKYVPLYGYAVEDMRFTWWIGLQGAFGLNPPEDHIRGFNPRDRVWTDDFARFKAQHAEGFRVEVEPAGVQALEELLQLCEDQGIRVLMVYSPEFYEAQEMTSNRTEIFNLFRQIAERRHVTFWDFSDWAGCRQQEYFQNSQHLNRRGAAAFSTALAERLKVFLQAPEQRAGN